MKCFTTILLIVWCSITIHVSHGHSEAVAPNVVLILTDDMGWDISALGHPNAITPNMDRLVEEGLTFEAFYSAAPICTLSRAAFYTGHFPYRQLGQGTSTVGATHLHKDVTTIFDMAKSRGYKTGLFGKWHLGDFEGNPMLKDYGIDRGKVTGNGPYGEPTYSNFVYNPNSAQMIAGDVNQMIADCVSNEDKFFVVFASRKPHTPVVSSAAQREMFADMVIDRSKYGLRMQEWMDIAEVYGGDIHELMAHYLANIWELDYGIGSILDQLDSLGVAEDTIVILTSDNGPELYIPSMGLEAPGMGNRKDFRGAKHTNREAGVRVPFVIRWPGFSPAGGVDEVTIQNAVDLFPTLAELWGIDIGWIRTDGESMLSSWKGTPAQRSKPMVWVNNRWPQVYEDARRAVLNAPQYGMRVDEWKIYANEDGSELELYNLEFDSAERSEVSGAFPDVSESLLGDLLALQRQLPLIPEPSYAFSKLHQVDEWEELELFDFNGNGTPEYIEEAIGAFDASSGSDARYWSVKDGYLCFRYTPWPYMRASVSVEASLTLGDGSWQSPEETHNMGDGWIQTDIPFRESIFMRFIVGDLSN